MKNKYVIRTHTYNIDSEKHEYVEDVVVADAVVNNEGYLTFFNTEQVEGAAPKPTLVKIVRPSWDTVTNMGAYIEVSEGSV